MATSGSIDFSVSRDNIITDALTMVGAIGVGDTVAAAQTTYAARILNMIVKAWQSKGIQLWARKTGYVLPYTGTNKTILGQVSTDGHATLSYTQTTLTAAAASGASTITVASVTGISTTYFIGVTLSDDTIHWTTVNGAPVGLVVTLTATLTGAASSGAYVYVYQTKLQRPVRIIDAYVHNVVSDIDIPIEIVPKSQYDLLGKKSELGTPNQCVYDPQLGSGDFYVYPRFKGGQQLITIIFQRTFEDFDAAGDTPDFPSEGSYALMMALAVGIAPAYGLPVQDRALLRAEAKEAFDLFVSNEPEEGSYYIQPDIR